MVTTPLTGDVPPSSMPNSAPYSRQGLHRNKSGLGHAVSNGFVKWTALTQPNYAAVLHGINDMRYEEFPLASTLKEGTVRIQVKAVGICGSDVHYWKRGRIADFVVNEPMVIGHESAGVVVEIGFALTGLRRTVSGAPHAFDNLCVFWSSRMQLCHTTFICQHRSRDFKPLTPHLAAIRAPCSEPSRRAASSDLVVRAATGGYGSTAREPNFDSVRFRQESGASASTTAVIDVTDDSQKHTRMEEVKQFLEAELGRIFNDGEVTRAKYAADMKFQDPIVNYASLDGFVFNIRALRTAFKVTFDLHNIDINGPEEIRTRWTMTLKSRFLPWQPKLVFSGYSYYAIDAVYGKIAGQRDVWDAIQDNSSPSIEGVAHVIKQLTDLQQTPNLDSPHYIVLKKTKEYEVRQYSPYLVAETSMPSGTRPAGGDGFNNLAGYIFGGNSRSTKMEMTTPVISTGGQQGPSGDKMQFPIERKYGEDPDVLPLPNDARVTRKMEEGGILAATSFPGIPLDFQVTEAERKLRAALLLDGYSGQEGYQLARYNDPFTLPFLRRNEVLIAVEDFELN